ncbi:MAG: bifunctional methylenetetrahydrofolate dehydrogenase/methenyltetrahydrofolate cyclohydrolase FolD [Pseudomonadota bacterium]|nr:bifunctional methylenetetrahydrofolate dehydrogenase/methenyltetrahydrofolate cyclohydrolase FolD [Pseudomonadota bacterium]
MTAKIIDGNELSRLIRADFKTEVEALKGRGITPGLAVVIVGDDPASHVYVRNKVKACANVGIHSELHAMPAGILQAELLAKIHALNNDPAIHGILVQLPVPKHIDNKAIIKAIAAEKDVDGFHLANLGALVVGEPTFQPCTPYGVMRMLDYHNIPIEGQHVVVIGRSNIAGKPMALMLINRSATVTVCTSKTRNLGSITRLADILVVATGKANMITVDMVKDGAVVIDIGINRLPDGKLAGDVHFDTVKEKASYITPVPGGVGPMTITMLLSNTIAAAKQTAKNK